jgi:hypothetical protein
MVNNKSLEDELWESFDNPFRPGAGHKPPHIAGRKKERDDFVKLLRQTTILENAVVTGLRGVGKTVLLEHEFKPLAIRGGWLWVGTDLSETTSISQANIATRLLTDLAVVTSRLTTSVHHQTDAGFARVTRQVEEKLDYKALATIFTTTPGLIEDKLKAVLELAWTALAQEHKKGVIFAYDEAQNLADHPAKEEFPLSLLLDVFQSIQRKGIPMMLVLTGLPTLMSKLVEARTYAERMFTVTFVDRLSREDSREAVVVPISKGGAPPFSDESVEAICDESGGYPYFIQFICKEVFDVFIQQAAAGEELAVPIEAIIRKLDADFFAGRWGKATDRQRELLRVIASLEPDGEFTVQEVVERSGEVLSKPFKSSHANQILGALAQAGLIYKTRHGKYTFAVPLLGNFILRQSA